MMKLNTSLQSLSHSKCCTLAGSLNGRRSKPSRISCAIAAPPAEEVKMRVKRNENFGKLQAGYLFPEIARRRRAHQEKHPDAKIISLGIGDTTEPIPKSIAEAMQQAAAGMATLEGYSGYGAEQGKGELREALCQRFYSHVGRKPNEIFVSDGSKCDIGRLQMMFGADTTVAVQDPSYPVYVDSSVIMGMTGEYDEGSKGFGKLQYMVCRPENDFFPDLSKVQATDLIFFCNPNNPTGAAATRKQLEELVAFARKNGAILVYDAAYAIYIADSDLPQTIFEIPGAEECAMETCSFSKYAGFTGVRLGWTVVPEQLKFADGSPVIADFNRIMTTIFNGASVIAQAGGLAALQDEGFREMSDLVAFYRENAAILRKTFVDLGFSVYGGENAPYIWVGFPGKPSWDVFAEILEKCNIVTTPGSGFGPAGEGFVRASAFGHREDILEAVERFKKEFGKQ
ncbi:LL-diaminopimelate aminotransferase, chloroplastic [Coccomyxa viridis]|uniref:LL-diaminopimelate aminotransferase, chloroplastic n=1 Tax=Coccomyxa viridis TaxID=1274662 RepID=A0AAV1I9A5_9CHLO|nr:LL-diaminopimelate aminotransferase, chloroplastic [Coccomyxa viridis]